MTRTCVIVSPYFPPSTLAGVHRARHLAKHLPAAGWTPIVLCVDEAHHEERLDPGLASLVPETVEIIKTPAISHRLTRPFGLGELSLRGLLPLRRELFRLLETRSVGAVLITGSPYYPMLLAGEVKRRFGTPVVLDFQDPWISAWGAKQPPVSKAGLSHWLATQLEPRAVTAADFITSVSETQNSEMAARYSGLDRRRMSAIPIGSDPEDFDALRDTPTKGGAVSLDRSCINLSYVGNIWPGATEPLKVFLGAVARLAAAQPELARRLRINFVGTSNQPNEFTRFAVRPLAEAAGVGAIVKETPQRVPYLEALSILAASDGLVMIGSDEPHYTASKIYPNLMSGRPYLSLFHRASSAHEILSAAGGGDSFAFSTADELASLENPLSDGLIRLICAPESLGKADPAVYAPYEASSIARQYGDIFSLLDAERIAPCA